MKNDNEMLSFALLELAINGAPPEIQAKDRVLTSEMRVSLRLDAYDPKDKTFCGVAWSGKTGWGMRHKGLSTALIKCVGNGYLARLVFLEHAADTSSAPTTVFYEAELQFVKV